MTVGAVRARVCSAPVGQEATARLRHTPGVPLFRRGGDDAFTDRRILGRRSVYSFALNKVVCVLEKI